MESDDDGASDVERLNRIRREFERAENRGDPSAQIERRAEDEYVRMPPGEPAMDYDAAAESLREVYDDYDIEVDWRSDGILVSGDLAVDSGTFSIETVPTEGDESTRRSGNWILVYRRASDGSWEVVRDMYNWND